MYIYIYTYYLLHAHMPAKFLDGFEPHSFPGRRKRHRWRLRLRRQPGHPLDDLVLAAVGKKLLRKQQSLVGGLEHDSYFPFHIWGNPEATIKWPGRERERDRQKDRQLYFQKYKS